MTHNLFLRLAAIGLSGLLNISLLTSPSAAETKGNSDSQARQGLPGRRIGGGTRPGEYSAYMEHKPLVALMPENNLGITTEAYPTLLFHLPVFEEDQLVEFVLYNSADEMVYEATFNVVGDSGIFDLSLSDAEGLEPLVIDNTYKWYFVIVANDRSQDIVVDGWVKRVDLDIWLQEQDIALDFTNRLDAATPLLQARLLGQEAALWPDAAFVLHRLRRANPEDVETAVAWAQLLQAMGFSNMDEEPVAELSLMPITSE